MKRWIHQVKVLRNVLSLLVRIFHRKLLCMIRGKTTVVIAISAHIGDNVAIEPLGRRMKRERENVEIIWLTSRAFIPLVNLFPAVDYAFSIVCPSVIGILQRLPAFSVIVPDVPGRVCSHCLFSVPTKSLAHEINFNNYYSFGCLYEVFQLCAGLSPENDAPILKTSVGEKGIQYVLVAAGSHEYERRWNDTDWQSLLNSICSQGVRVIEIGLKSVAGEFRHDKFDCQCGEKDLAALAHISAGAVLFIGVDSGPAHIANACRVPAILLFGNYKNFTNYMPYSGFYAENLDFFVRHTGALDQLPLTTVQERWEKVSKLYVSALTSTALG